MVAPPIPSRDFAMADFAAPPPAFASVRPLDVAPPPAEGEPMSDLRRRGLISALWGFVLFNVLFRDLQEYLEPGFLADLSDGALGAAAITPWLLLMGGLVMEGPIAMTVLARLLPWGALRVVTAALGAMGAAATLGGAPRWDPDDAFFAAMQGLGYAALVWTTFMPAAQARRA